MKKTFLYVIVVLFHFSFCYADLIKPRINIEPDKVVSIQLKGLMKNDIPSTDYGIKQTWEFAHPVNKKYTGPLPKFLKMIKSNNYIMLLDHLSHEIKNIYSSPKKVVFEVFILDKNKNYYKFQWIVEKYSKEGPLKDCWLTTSVSNPISLGSST